MNNINEQVLNKYFALLESDSDSSIMEKFIPHVLDMFLEFIEPILVHTEYAKIDKQKFNTEFGQILIDFLDKRQANKLLYVYDIVNIGKLLLARIDKQLAKEPITFEVLTQKKRKLRAMLDDIMLDRQFLNTVDDWQIIKNKFKEMDQIQYGWLDKAGQPHIGQINPQDFYYGYRLQSPQQCMASHVGVCWDQVEVQRKFLEDMKLPVKSYYIELQNKTKSSHTFIFFEYRDNMYYIEHSWQKFRGIYPIDNNDVNKMLHTIMERHTAEEKDGSACKIWEYKKPEFGVSAYRFMLHAKGKL